MVSFLCCYNRLDVFHSVLEPSLAKYDGCELLAEENAAGESIPRVLNRLARQAQGQFLCFVHQDAVLLSADWPALLERVLGDLPDAGLVGVIGKRDSGEAFVGSLVQADGTFLGMPVVGPTKVATVDEVRFAVPRSTWKGQPLDERFTLHYYAVDYCLQVAERGLKAYVVPALLQHRSRTPAGDIASSSFRECQRLLLAKWRRPVNATTGFLPYPDLLEDVEAPSPEEADLPVHPVYAQAFHPRRDTLSAVQLRVNNWSATPVTLCAEVRRGHPAAEVLVAASAGAPPHQGSLATFLFDPVLRMGALAEGEWLWILLHGGHSDRIRCVVHRAPHDARIGPALVAHDEQRWGSVQVKGIPQVLAFRTCY